MLSARIQSVGATARLGAAENGANQLGQDRRERSVMTPFTGGGGGVFRLNVLP